MRLYFSRVLNLDEQSAQIHALPFETSGSALSTSGVNTASTHQHRSNGLPVALATSIAHMFVLPQRGQIEGSIVSIPASYLWFVFGAKLPHPRGLIS